MEAVRLHVKVKSDTLKIQGVSRFIGKKVEVILINDDSEEKPKKRNYKLEKLRGKIRFDEDAVNSLRNISKL